VIEEIRSYNIDSRVMKRCADVLAKGGVIACPTDTNWCVCCSSQSKEGIRRLRAVSGGRDERHFTLVCGAVRQFGDYVDMDNAQYRLINKLTPGPYVFILKTLHGAEKALGLKRKELGVHIPATGALTALVEAAGAPLYSVTAKREMEEEGYSPTGADDGFFIPEDELYEAAWELEGIAGIDVVLDHGDVQRRVLSTVIDMTGEEPVLVRAGEGDWPV
jgi:tRNA threonylcarbamoyl adenosine modification protein (Sua5/YciO/YrdC/YwlC family)